MEQQFKKILQKTKDQNNPLFKSFEGSLFRDSAWFFSFLDTEIEVISETQNSTPAINKIDESINEAPAKKSEPVYRTPTNSLCDVVFVGDTFIGEKGSDQDLLGKMIGAMKLFGNEYYRFSLDEELESVVDLAYNLENPTTASLNLLNFINEKKPKTVVSLGATVTNILLGKREKLSTIHGQFFEKQYGDTAFSLMPVFHPDFLVINPNMKRTAWADLQKVMERVGKI